MPFVSESTAYPSLEVRQVSGFSDSVAATQVGTWTVQPGNTANTTAWLVNQEGRTATGSISTLNGVVTLTNLAGIKSVGVVLTGTWVATITPEVSVDSGTTWYAVEFFNLAGYVSTTAANNTLIIPFVAGMTQVRVRASAYTSGTINVSFAASQSDPPAMRVVEVSGQTIATTAKTNYEFAEDSAHTSADIGAFVLGVRNDTNVTRTNLDNEYTPFSVDLAGNVRGVGNRDHDATDAGSPTKIGGRADTTFQAAVADGDRVDALFDVYGQQHVRIDNANNWSYHENSSLALTDTSVRVAPGVGLSTYVTDIVVSTGAATAFNIFFKEGATTILGPYYLEAVNGRGLAIHFITPKKVTANTALTVTTSAAIAHAIDVMGFTAP